uniref:Uncharacterized protein n=1 Tax=Pleurostichidium falkenbergii TaxID=121064 RepID=A0A4D6UXB7_9FLOR|nr:hypothetical protein [Pleurostichidium falkenbergii]QCH39625.1 hypothetical protein [Pleurostichidium falkenbergii]
MILFNFILSHKFKQNYCNNFAFCQSQFRQEYFNFHKQYFTHNSKLSKINNLLISKASNIRQLSSSDLFINEIENNNLVSRKFWQKLVNKYIQETIVLSSPSTMSSNYINKLRASGLSVYKGNEHKSFLYQFTRSITGDKAKVSLSNLNILNNLSNRENSQTYLTYKWPKFFNFKNVFFFNNKQYISNILNFSSSSLPLFIVVNSNKEIVVAESTDQLSKNGFLFNLCNYFNNSKNYKKNLYTGLLFVNPKDAVEYKYYIEALHSNSTRSVGIKVVPINMHLYDRLINLKNASIEFRLVPDLKEISNLIYKYKKYKHISFNRNQKYTHNSFQGQPIYSIKPFYSQQKYSNYSNGYNSLNNTGQSESDSIYQTIFFNYNTLMGAWNRFKKENIKYSLPLKPEISVSNFETFIQSNYNENKDSKLTFLPSVNAYDFIKSHLNTKSQYGRGLKHTVLRSSLSLKTFFYRVFWSLTSKQPINW